MILFYLILGHFTGDFLLQPLKLIEWKIQSEMGLFAHSAVHFLINITILSAFLKIFLSDILLLSLIVFGSHFLIDKAKIWVNMRYGYKKTAFIVDQIAHLAVLTSLWLFFIV